MKEQKKVKYSNVIESTIATDLLKAMLGNGSVSNSNEQQWKLYLGGRIL
jgi:hypothetical protein